MEHEKLVNLFNLTLDILCDMFGGAWLVDFGIDNGLTDEEIKNWLIDDDELIAARRAALKEEE